VFGANSSDGKGNIAIGAEYYNRDAQLAVNNDFYTKRYNDPYAAGYFSFLQGTTNIDCQFNCFSTGAVNAIFGKNPFNPGYPNQGTFRPVTFNADGTVFAPNGTPNWVGPSGVAKFKQNPDWTFFPYKAIDASTFYNPANPSATQVFDG